MNLIIKIKLCLKVLTIVYQQKLGVLPRDDFDLTVCYQALLLSILLESRVIENLIMLIIR